jgi:hypothetical protein
MPKMDITFGVGRLGVFSVALYTFKEKEYFHFPSREQAMGAISKVEKNKTIEELRAALKKLCGEDYYSPAEEASKSRGIHSSSSSQSISSHSG